MRRVLYALAATGNGHINRAMTIIPELKKRTDVDILISGDQSELDLPFEVAYKLKGMSYYYDSKGGIKYLKTISNLNVLRFIKDVFTIPIEDYDLVISDFEPISVWAAKLKEIPSVALCNQAVIMQKGISRPDSFDFIPKLILKHLVPGNQKFGYHYLKLSENIFTPVIRKEIREAEISDKAHYTVYLPSYSDEKLISFLSGFKNVEWHVFSKNSCAEYKSGNISIFPVNKEKFTQSITGCRGIICNAGFETTAEALFLGKKLLAIPQTGQYEQLFNTYTLNSIGIKSVNKLNTKNKPVIDEWINNGLAIKMDYPDLKEEIVSRIISLNTKPKVSKIPEMIPDMMLR